MAGALRTYRRANHLGTTSFVTNGLGACLQDQRYYPWGQQWDNPCGQHDLHFASMQQADA